MIEDYGRGYSSTLMNSGYFPNVIDDYVYYVNENIDWFYKIINTEPQSGKFGIYVKSAEDIKINVVQGTQFSLPELVNITTIADSEDKANVIWNTPEIDTSKVGEYTFEGTILGYNKKVIATINVIDSTSIEK